MVIGPVNDPVKAGDSALGVMGGVVADTSFERVLEKDNLKSRYYISQDDRRVEAQSLEEAMGLMQKVADLEVAPLSILLPGESYRVEIQVKLEEFRLPFHLHRILPFMSFWDVTTPWSIHTVSGEGKGG